MVIAIIAVLVALLFPVLVSARDAAFKTATMGQMQQLVVAANLYTIDFDGHYAPSTNYGVPKDVPERMWTNLLRGYARDEGVFIARGTNAKFAAEWNDRGDASIGLNSATAIDMSYGCYLDQPDKTGCQAFRSSFAVGRDDQTTLIPLFAVTPFGNKEVGYRGYEFNPYNGLPRSEGDVRESPPLVADRDLVAELMIVDGEFIKPIHARYGSNGKDDGQTPVAFADGHARSYSAKIIKGKTGVQWRFR